MEYLFIYLYVLYFNNILQFLSTNLAFFHNVFLKDLIMFNFVVKIFVLNLGHKAFSLSALTLILAVMKKQPLCPGLTFHRLQQGNRCVTYKTPTQKQVNRTGLAAVTPQTCFFVVGKGTSRLLVTFHFPGGFPGLL